MVCLISDGRSHHGVSQSRNRANRSYSTLAYYRQSHNYHFVDAMMGIPFQASDTVHCQKDMIADDPDVIRGGGPSARACPEVIDKLAKTGRSRLVELGWRVRETSSRL